MDITRFPYFSYQDMLEPIANPITSMANIKFLTFRRKYLNKEQLLISNDIEFSYEYYSKELYHYGVFEKDIRHYESTYHMWDHFPSNYPRHAYDHIIKTS
ncbi:MAG: hypothetical protein K2Y18_03790 [Alphaproteobacteria bacterium]|jgi:hypothetical protein|nr:hypothetical protein [Alphaproteobacteria bacterium]